MTPMLRMLLCFGLSMGRKTAVLAGILQKPTIWAEPGLVIAQHMPVIIWCQGSWEAQEYYMHKEGSIDPWDRQFPLEQKNKAKFHIDEMSKDFAGIYKCYYKSPAGLSEHSDTLVLVLTGAYDEPSLYVWPSPAVTSGECITMQCISSLGFDRFILIQEGKYNLSWTLDSQQLTNMLFQAHFVLGSVTANHNGTFRCYGCFMNNTQMWSTSSNPLDIQVSESSALQHEGHTIANLIQMVVAALALVTLVVLLLEAWHSKRVEKHVTRRKTCYQNESKLSDSSTKHGQTSQGEEARTIARLIMTLMLRMLLCIGLSVGHKTTLLAGSLPKPIIWAEPHSAIAIHTPVTIWCQGPWEAVEYLLYKEGNKDPWDRQLPLEQKNKAKFQFERMLKGFAGIYKCYYRSPAGFSERSDTLVLVLTGAYIQPSLSVWPSSAVTSGESITMQCSSSLGFDRFILIQEGKHNLSWTLDSQQHDKMSFQAHFVLGSVTANHNGTFRCYGYFKNVPQIWSTSSNPLDIFVSEPPASQNQHHIVENLLRMFMAALVLVTLVILLLEAWYCQKMGKYSIKK
ncbi:immunoglobulin superfamily member 1-like [Alexandromys fortis]|uniref:immunoglobulin superfamily member 1-like n=1 Tax=Alexandromys fortis TaxID=100897 RepID=UPI0021532842|nr:immunoglobulin superfamily member 1-like [Microtus fortis]